MRPLLSPRIRQPPKEGHTRLYHSPGMCSIAGRNTVFSGIATGKLPMFPQYFELLLTKFPLSGIASLACFWYPVWGEEMFAYLRK